MTQSYNVENAQRTLNVITHDTKTLVNDMFKQPPPPKWKRFLPIIGTLSPLLMSAITIILFANFQSLGLWILLIFPLLLASLPLVSKFDHYTPLKQGEMEHLETALKQALSVLPIELNTKDFQQSLQTLFDSKTTLSRTHYNALYNIASRFTDLNNSIVQEKQDFVIQQANQPITHNFTDMRQHTVTVEKETDLKRNQPINILDSISNT